MEYASKEDRLREESEFLEFISKARSYSLGGEKRINGRCKPGTENRGKKRKPISRHS